MPPAHPPPLSLPDYVGPVVGAAIFVLLMGFVKEPARRTVNAVLFPFVAMPVAYVGLQSYPPIAVALFMHAAWDLLHHLWGGSIWPFMPTASFGCLIFDSLTAIWFLMGAPSARHAIQDWSEHRRLAPRP